MLPFIIIFFMILVIDYNSEIVNKVLIDSNRTINYPFFDNDNVDLFIENYLNRTSNNYSDDIFIDYDGYLKENKYYLNFYKYIVGSGKISNDIDSFIICLIYINFSYKLHLFISHFLSPIYLIFNILFFIL